LNDILGGHAPAPHVPRDRRTLLPLAPSDRQAGHVAVPGHQQDLRGTPSSGPRVMRRRLDGGPWAPLKIASGCDRRCAFCAIPAFRGAYLSRPADEVVTEAQWLADHGVKEILLVSENSSSYGKDLGDMRALEKLLVSLSAVDGLDRIRVSYLQPAEVRPDLLDAMTSVDKVVPYFDLSFQHASPTVLRRMRRFGDPDSFASLIDQIRTRAPLAGIRSNFIAGFPGETEDDVEMLESFLVDARLDVVGVFGYSDEEGTEAVGLDGHLEVDEIEDRRARLTDLVEELSAQRAEDRVGEVVEVLVETVAGDSVTGRAAHQGPEVDGETTLPHCSARIGDLVTAVVTSSEGVDLHASVLVK
ncbi:MAG TPA: MiaB/RimO family radical SAM methylthiotransferase, partial [Propionibacteriaceae bacterium]|nr:MiaB/RimO family radical SAM methylthiotransferase [Propionibacteriaceae bacterium]